MAEPKRPVLRYHGGKWRLAPWIIAHFPPHRVYVEPFGGAASVLMRKPRSYAEVYGDVDDEIVNVFRVLRDPTTAGELATQLELTPFSSREFEIAYQPSDEPIERARRTMIKAYMGFGTASVFGDTGKPNTGFRANSNRSGTTPARDWRNFPPAISDFCERLQGVVLEHRAAQYVMAQHDSPETLHYVDPPYVRATRGRMHRANVYRHEIDDQGHRELAATLHGLAGMVVLSGYHSKLYDALYGDWRTVERAAHADGAKDRIEVLWLNAAASERIGQQSLSLGGAA